MTAEEFALREMKAAIEKLRSNLPAPQFNGKSQGPFYEYSSAYTETRDRFLELERMFPAQFETLTDEEQGWTRLAPMAW